jgi:hypothetical protein
LGIANWYRVYNFRWIFLNGVIFFDANNGVAFGDPEGGEFEIYTSNNGGTSWTRVAGGSVPNLYRVNMDIMVGLNILDQLFGYQQTKVDY